MGTTTKLLSRHLRRRRLLSPSISLLSHSSPLQNPNPHSSPNLSKHWQFTRTLPRSSTPNFSNNISFRSFSWHSWTDESENRGDDCTSESSEIGSELSSLGQDVSEIVEEAVAESIWYAPVHAVISLLDGFHDLTGLPWWVIISTSTLALRVSLLPVLILQLKKVGEIAKLYPKLPPPLPIPLSGKSFHEQFLLFQKKRRELGCPSFLWSFASFLVQVPCFFIWMTSIRRMCLDHHPGFDCGGMLWFQNLTDFPHGTCGPIFPILIAGLHFTNVQVSFQTFKVANLHGILGLLAKYYKLYLDVLAIPLLLIGFLVPQGSLVYWVTNSSLTLVLQLSLKTPYIRKKLGLPDETVMTKHEKSGSLEHLIPAEDLSSEKLLDLALEQLAADHQDRALPLLRMAIEKDPELVRALVALGQIMCSKGLLVEAAEYFERAISKIPEEDVSLLVLATFGAGVSHIWQGKKSEGIEYLKRIAQLEVPEKPMDKACYYKGLVILGSTLFQEGEKSEAAKYLRIAATYDPNVNIYVKECEEG